MTRNFTAPQWLPKQAYGTSGWHLCTLISGANVWGRYEFQGYAKLFIAYFEDGSKRQVLSCDMRYIPAPEYAMERCR